MTDPLRMELRVLARDLREHGVPLIVGGGYGLVLKTEIVQQSGARTLMQDFPDARSTEDIDILLKAEVISDPKKTGLIREALDRRGYRPVVRNFQFQREIDYAGATRRVRVDFLAAPVSGELENRVRADRVRIRPRDGKGLHAHVTPEALTVEEYLVPVNIGADGESLTIYIPHPFSYLLLKLHALRDRIDDENSDYGRHHAFDLYTTVATMTEKEWEDAARIKEKHDDAGQVVEARRLVSDLFAGETSTGTLRLREHARSVRYDLDRERLNFFVESLRELIG